MDTLRVFFDCEYTDPDLPLLISAGFVTEDGAELYTELSDCWLPADCSPAVRATVLPLLDAAPEQKMCTTDFARHLSEWLRNQAGRRPLAFLSGSHTDWWLLADCFLTLDRAGIHAVFPHSRYQTIDTLAFPHSLGWGPEGERIFRRAREACFERHNGARAHALVGAKALREGYLAAARHAEVVRSVRLARTV